MERTFLKYVPILAFITIMTMYVEMVILPSLPEIENQFSITSSEASWILSSETLAGMALAPFLGKLADNYGRKKVLVFILIAYTLSVFLTAISPNYPILILSRSIQGIGLSINPIAYTILRERIPDRELPIAQGIIASTFAVGAAIAIPIGSYISQYFSWEFAYETAIPLLILSIIITYAILPSSESKIVSKELDTLGILLLSLSFLVLGVGLTEAPTWGWLSSQFFTSLAISFLLFYIFSLHISKTDNPVINPQDFKNPNIAVPLISSFITGFGLFLTFQSLVFIFELPSPVGYGMDILQTGETMAPIALIMLVAGPFFGSLVPKVGYKKVILLSSSVSSLLLLLLSYIISIKVSIIELMGFLALILFFISGMNVTRVTLLIASSDRERMSTLTGTNTAMRLMGNTLGPIVVGSLEDTFKTPLFEGYINNIPMFAFIPSRLAFEYSFLVSMGTTVLVSILATRIKEEIRNRRISVSIRTS
ncbi:MFS transporter [Sulfurisphaera ohwakuensis]|uniref:MFS family permease n=1 Tax=Sulfurisphaera ohwakuensis TaxID=69656 RepID=A0A650CJY3_SULOH|nr:MFS transporter [Sulfurisphaera ohwakuensis]MBB5254287.1 MFS family permease [Sulfurisphaera ohwakuensis]QGR18184.1 MFS transporter [Sulfurisphaera ohwakuensis]